jgi:hypothetical protein
VVLRNLTKVQRERRFQCSKKIIMCVPIYNNDDAHFVVKLPQKVIGVCWLRVGLMMMR